MPSEREYELVYIVAPTATDEEVEALQTQVAEIVQEFGGTVENTDLWGRRKLAYEIGRFTEGIYIVQVLDGPGKMISELGRRLRVRDQVLRHLIVRVDEDLRKVRRAAEKKKATVQRRRAARGKPPLPDGPEGPEGDAAAPAPDSSQVAPAPEGDATPPVAEGDAARPAEEASATPVTEAETTEAAEDTTEVQK
jgi:small subunit ribosomal protein S6